MKWYQHESNCHNDEIMRELIHEFGVEGYGVYHICLELIAEKIDEKMQPILRISERVLREKLRVSRQKLTEILLFFDRNSFIFSNLEGKYWILNCPNLLKRLDNWTKRSVVTSQKVTLQGEGELEREEEGEGERKNSHHLVSHETNSKPKSEEIKVRLDHPIFSRMTQVQKNSVLENYLGNEDWLFNTLTRYITTAAGKVSFMNPDTVFEWLRKDFATKDFVKPKPSVNPYEAANREFKEKMEQAKAENNTEPPPSEWQEMKQKIKAETI